MSLYLDRLEAARRQQQMAAAGCFPPPRPWPCYQYQHAAALLPRSPRPLPVPVSPHAGMGNVAVARSGGGAAGWDAVAAAGGWVGDAARRQQQMAAACYQYQHAAVLLPRSPRPLPVPVSPHAGVGSVAVARSGGGGGAAGWDAVAAAGWWVGDAARGGVGSVPTAPAREEAGGVGGGEAGNKRCSPARTPGARSPPPKRRAVAARRRFPPGCGRDAAAAPPLPGTGCGDSRSDPARRRDGGSGALQDSPPRPTATLAAGKNTTVLSEATAAASPSAASGGWSALNYKVPGKNSAAAADALSNHTGSRGVAGPGIGDQILKKKDDLLVAPMLVLPKPIMVSAFRRFPPGCGRPGSPLLAGVLACAAEADHACATEEDELKIVAPVCATEEDGAAKDEGLEEGEVAPGCSGTEDGAAQSDGLEEGEIAPGCSGTEDEAAKSEGLEEGEEMVGNAWQSEESKSGGSSSCIVVAAESLSQGLPREHLETGSVSECATDMVSSGAAAGVSDGGATTRKKVMFTPRKSVKPPKSIQKPDLNTFSKETVITHYFGPKKKKVSDKEDSILKHDEVLKALPAVHEAKFEPGQPQDADARSKVKMLCNRFESICRSIVQAVEQRSLKIRRVDLAADKVIRKLPGFTKLGPIVGNVPGVEVGDEFLYRVQLALVGLHRPYQGGIDTTRDEHGMLIAISVVASGGYPDELSCPGELIYTGSGGKKGGRDQKLENGNLALRNCVERKSPVRVIHGFKDQNREEGSHSRAKEVSRFTYDGLYRVVNCWREGRPGSKVFKYKLQRIPGQPGHPLQVAKFLNARHGHDAAI
ncbi:unnamed protein product [Urochloa decumbens]|uniref:YDG domain-containing protein n=1 Tax=Urochloa decumbens TaxID=240449 RepID=A0ABC9BSD9_9POAL